MLSSPRSLLGLGLLLMAGLLAGGFAFTAQAAPLLPQVNEALRQAGFPVTVANWRPFATGVIIGHYKSFVQLAGAARWHKLRNTLPVFTNTTSTGTAHISGRVVSISSQNITVEYVANATLLTTAFSLTQSQYETALSHSIRRGASVTVYFQGTTVVGNIVNNAPPGQEATFGDVESDDTSNNTGTGESSASSSGSSSAGTPTLAIASAENDADNIVGRDQDITYTITLSNTGTASGTGVDLTDTITGSVGSAGTFGFANCGSSYVNNSSGAAVNIADLTVAVGTNCVVTFHVTVSSSATDGSTITDSADATAATEGGNNPSPVSADALTVNLIAYWEDGTSVGNLTSTSDWQEISGMTQPTLSANSAYLWMQSDGSVDKLFAVTASNAASAGEWALSGIDGVDYEDLSSARVGGQSYLYLADIGDNANGRSTFIIYRIKEPTITGSNGTISAGDIETITSEFPAGSLPTHKDAEVLLVDPDTGDMYVITKRESVPGVYKLAHASSYSGTQTFTDMGNMFDIPDVASVSATGNAVGGNISPNGEEILVKSYDVMYHFARNKSTQTIIEALQQTPTTVDGYVGGGSASPKKSHPTAEPQGEAVTFDYNGSDYYTASEFVAAEGSTSTRYPLFKYERLASIPTTITFQDGVSPTAGYASTLDTYIWDTAPDDATVGTAVTFIADKALGVETDQRKSLLKFDISTIPAGATIVGARLDLFLSVEGQGWSMYRILTANWNESSTYNTLTGGVNDDGTEASTTEDNRNGVNLDTVASVTVRNNMRLDTIQAWVAGTQTNYGWLIESTDIAGGDGIQFASRQATTASQRPKLIIRYTGP
jgi:uncharacterized repeat protein (TIGR01451 family)